MLSWTHLLENTWYKKFLPIKLPWDSTPMSPEECWEERLGSDSAKPRCKVRRLRLRASNFPESSMDWLIAYSSIRRSDSAVERIRLLNYQKESWKAEQLSTEDKLWDMQDGSERNKHTFQYMNLKQVIGKVHPDLHPRSIC